MVSPLLGKIADTIGKAFATTFYEATLTRVVKGSPVGGPDWDRSGAETITDYQCKGIIDEYSDYAISNSLVERSDRKVLILSTSLAVEPKKGDRVTIRGGTYTVMNVGTDPAKAVWELQSRR